MFQTGVLVMTNGVNNRVANDTNFAKFITKSLRRFLGQDWGDLCKEDKAMNDRAIKYNDDRIFAKYNYEDEPIYIITEWDRSVTTILFAEEY